MSKEAFIEQLTSLKGIGKAKAEALLDQGYDSIETILAASIEDLTKVNGISEQIANSIQTQLKEQQSQQPTEPVKKPADKKPSEKKPTKTAKKPLEKPKDTPIEKEVKKPTQKTKQKQPAEEKEDEPTEPTDEYLVKKKAELSEDLQQKLQVRKQIKKRTPTFLREEWFRYKRIPKNWRRPDGLHSKMRINRKYRQNRVRVGFRGPKEARGLHSSGFEEVMVYNVKDLEAIDPTMQAARIGSSVGTKKRMAIEEKAKELDIRLLNKR